MIHKMYVIRDTKANAFLPPFILPQEGMAIRTFSDCINSDDHQFGAHPEDYALFYLGTYDDESGILDTDLPKVVRNGLELVNPKETAKEKIDIDDVVHLEEVGNA